MDKKIPHGVRPPLPDLLYTNVVQQEQTQHSQPGVLHPQNLRMGSFPQVQYEKTPDSLKQQHPVLTGSSRPHIDYELLNQYSLQQQQQCHVLSDSFHPSSQYHMPHTYTQPHQDYQRRQQQQQGHVLSGSYIPHIYTQPHHDYQRQQQQQGHVLSGSFRPSSDYHTPHNTQPHQDYQRQQQQRFLQQNLQPNHLLQSQNQQMGSFHLENIPNNQSLSSTPPAHSTHGLHHPHQLGSFLPEHHLAGVHFLPQHYDTLPQPQDHKNVASPCAMGLLANLQPPPSVMAPTDHRMYQDMNHGREHHADTVDAETNDSVITVKEYVYAQGGVITWSNLSVGIWTLVCKKSGRKLIWKAVRHVIRMFENGKSWRGMFTLRHLIIKNGEFMIDVEATYDADIDSLLLDLRQLVKLLLRFFMDGIELVLYMDHLIMLASNPPASIRTSAIKLKKWLKFMKDHLVTAHPHDRLLLLKGFGCLLRYFGYADRRDLQNALEECFIKIFEQGIAHGFIWVDDAKTFPLVQDVFQHGLKKFPHKYGVSAVGTLRPKSKKTDGTGMFDLGRQVYEHGPERKKILQAILATQSAPAPSIPKVVIGEMGGLPPAVQAPAASASSGILNAQASMSTSCKGRTGATPNKQKVSTSVSSWQLKNLARKGHKMVYRKVSKDGNGESSTTSSNCQVSKAGTLAASSNGQINANAKPVQNVTQEEQSMPTPIELDYVMGSYAGKFMAECAATIYIDCVFIDQAYVDNCWRSYARSEEDDEEDL